MAIVIGTTYTQNGTRSGGSSYSLIAGIDYVLVSQDVINNTSLIKIRPWIKRPSNNTGSYNLSSATLNVKADSQSKTTSFTYDFRNTTTNQKYYVTNSFPFKRSSGSTDPYEFTVQHNTDGSKTVNLYAYFPLYSGSSTGNFTVDINVELPTIPRNSTLNQISSFNAEQDKIISITKNISSYYDVLKIYDINKSTLLATINGIQNGDTINLATLLGTTLLYNTMTTKFYKFYFDLYTYTDSSKTTQIGSISEVAGIGILSNAEPIFTNYDFEDDNNATYALTGNRSAIINGYSNLKLSNFNAIGQKNATINYWVVNGNSYTNTGSNIITINNYSQNTIDVYAQDSRQLSTQLLKTITNFIDYSKITKGSQSGGRSGGVSEQTTISFEGTLWNNNFGAQNNSLTVSYRYKETSSDTWNVGQTTITPTISGSDYSFSGAIRGDTSNGFDVGNSYNIEVTVSDKLSSVTFTYLIQSGKPAIALFGNKVALGDKFDENDTTHNVQLFGNVSYNGNEVFNDYIVEEGSNSNGSYIKYNSGVMICYKSVSGTAQITERYYTYFYHTSDSDYFNLGDYPVAFIERPKLSIQFYGGNSQWIGSIQNATASHVADLHILSVTSKTAGAYYDIIAIGRWK